MIKVKIRNHIFSWDKIKLIKDGKSESPISSLAPKILTKKEDLDKVQPYLDKLNETIDSKGINNIALTGGYGSGKSTILATFKKLNPQYEFLNISLASFNKKNADDTLTAADKKLQKEELERLLEVSILQQIFYHVKPDEIPESRFKRIINIPDWKIWCISIGFILWVSSSVLLLKYDYLDKINPNSWDSKYSFDFFALLIFTIVFSGLGLFSKLIIKLFSNSKINKVNIKGELELGDNANKSVFNEHLEEILYFFERTKYNVIIIEDLDRFDSTDIFTKLREINILLNNSKLINREINFVYAVGDDLFDDKKERVKFFEYIIPVIPFINSSNADDQLKTLISNAGLDENIFTKEFISDVTIFIDDIDMRLLTNIFHEFVIYRKTLKPEFIKKNDELFAMITYKNIDPKDFNKLNKREGNLYELVNNKKKYIKEFIEKIDTEILLKNSKIAEIEKHTISDVEELRGIYVNKVLAKLPSEAVINKDVLIELISEEGFKAIINGNLAFEQFSFHRSYNMYVKSNNNFSFNFNKIENEVNPNNSYLKRSELIRFKNNNKINLLKSEIEELQSNKSEIENWELKRVFCEIDIDQFLNDFSNNGLLRNFILNGYINENYNDYISLFHEVSITKEDYNFERNIKGGYSTDFNYKLSDKIENLVERINKIYFEREVILNFDLLDYLGNNYDKHNDKYDSIIRLLSNEKEKSMQFIDEYIKNEERPLSVFIAKLSDNWIRFWEYCYSNYSYEKQLIYLRLIIDNCTVDSILANQDKEKIKEAFETNIDFIKIILKGDGKDYDITLKNKLQDLITKLDVKFDSLEFNNDNLYKLNEFIYQNGHYKINSKNIILILKSFGQNINLDDFETSNYYEIMSSNCQPLIDYINSEINLYVNEVYLKLENNVKENEEALIDLLNDEKLDIELKTKIIEKVETKISVMQKIDDSDIYTLLLVNNKIVPRWDNLLYEYNNRYIENEETDNEENLDQEISDSIIEFINEIENAKELSMERIPKEVNSVNIYGKFWRKLIQVNEINDESYSLITKSSPWWYDNLAFEKLSENKIKFLIENTCISPTSKSFIELKETFKGLNIYLFETRKKEYFQILDQLAFDSHDIELILKSKIITNSEKLTILEQCSDEIIIQNSILKQLSFLLSNDNLFVVNDTILNSILNNSLISVNERILIFNKNYGKYNLSFIESFLLSLGGNYSQITNKKIKAKIEKNTLNHNLLKILEKKGYISSFSDLVVFYRINHKKN
ncbi:YobI family P-loop NTPase [Flavobacterium proteolyticum]|uniref:YobI-like P-loop NTPase domain-containing protein n=1 Tax=Flavobacterium proteolyticum TaxID=2911683 RepID=A0ABR9WTL1_9FLAO|nr:hypothetical protein [Flavobacterium proteolyticum]MBE9576984.1 hypothetical protein [Flavobacterium proteolyticum]